MPAVSESRFLVQATWDDVPHLDADTKRKLEASMSPHTRDARTKGVPALGSGAIYPVPESDFVVDPMPIPDWWERAYGLDVGWQRTAAIWGARDPATDVIYLYTEHYRGQAEPAVHAAAIRARGAWIPGIIDTAARGRSQIDGEVLMQKYVDQGLRLNNAVKAVEAGLFTVLERLTTGRLKIFSTCRNTLAELRIYRRDEKGAVVKKNDHLMDAKRYLVMGFTDVAKTRPVAVRRGPAQFGDRVVGY